MFCYEAAPPFGRPGTPPVRCCNLQCTILVLCCTWYVMLCYEATPPFGLPGTPPVSCCNLQCTIQGPLCVNENKAAVLIYSVQGPLCVNENNGHNVATEKIIGNKQKI